MRNGMKQWLVAVFVIPMVASCDGKAMDTEDALQQQDASAVQPKSDNLPLDLAAEGTTIQEPVSQAHWTVGHETDEWGSPIAGVTARAVGPARSVEAHHQGVRATLMVDCEMQIGVRFNQIPTLAGGEDHTGYALYRVGAKVDDSQPLGYKAQQEAHGRTVTINSYFALPSGNGLISTGTQELTEAMATGKSIAISFPWLTEGNVAFKWSLQEYASTLDEACGTERE